MIPIGAKMDEKKYQVFVSSTYRDLKVARDKIIETVLKLYHFPIGMEMFSADDDEQWEVIKDTIDMSDYYVVIIGHRYGTETTDGVSYTEKEYDYAKSQNIPVLAFIRKRDVATKPDERDKNPDSIEKLDRFVEKASQNKMCDFWETEDNLATKVAIALPKIFRKNPQIGWIRADKAISPQVSEEIAKLSSENRDLRIEKDQLKAQIEGKRPEISLKINDSEELGLNFIEKENLYIEIPKGHKLSFEPFEYPEKINPDSIPEHLNPFFETSASSDIDNYNNSLPTADDIDEYNYFKEIYFRRKSASIDLDISIENYGASKANDIFINIEFPSKIIVLKKRDIKDLGLPKNPTPDNPIKRAEKKFKEEQERRLKFDKLGFDPSIFSSGLAPFISPPHIPYAFNNISTEKEINTDLDKDENKITITVKSLLHTRKVPVDDFVALPLETGEFEIKVSIVCEEFSEPMQTIIPIKVS